MYARRRALPTKPALPAWKWLLPLLALLAVLWWAWHQFSQPRNPAVQVQAKARTVAQDWLDLKAFGPRPVGSSGHDQALNWLEQQFMALGYRVTRQPVTLERPFDLGGTLQVAGQHFPVQALYGAKGGKQQGRLVRVPPQATTEQMRELGVTAQIALTTCPTSTWRDLTERAVSAGAFGLIIVDDCAVQGLQKVDATPLPLVKVSASQKEAVLALAGRQANLTSRVQYREVTGENLIAAQVGAKPEVLLGAHLDTVNDTVGANDNASGVLAVLDAARRIPPALAHRTWFVLFDAEEDGVIGSRAFVADHKFALRDTRAMLNFDMVGINKQPLGVALHADLRPLVRQLRPGIRIFEDEPLDTREMFGRSAGLTGRSDHVAFKGWKVRTVFFHRGIDANYHASSDQRLDPALVEETSALAMQFSQAILQAPWVREEPCGITARDC